VSRRKKAVRRPVPADPRYDSQTVSKFLNNLMERGKKSLAERVFYQAMDLIEQRTGQPGVNVFKQALSNVKPAAPPTRCRSKCGPSGARRWACAG
jgi:small subunit ribosomal protein S7